MDSNNDVREKTGSTYSMVSEGNTTWLDLEWVTGGAVTSERGLWVVALLLYVVGDGVTTVIGLHVGMVEKSVVAAATINAVGFLTAFALLKTITLAVGAVLWRLAPDAYRLGVPLGLAAVGGVVTAGNAALLLRVA